MADLPATLVPARFVVPSTQDVSERFYAMALFLVCETPGEEIAIGMLAVMN